MGKNEIIFQKLDGIYTEEVNALNQTGFIALRPNHAVMERYFGTPTISRTVANQNIIPPELLGGYSIRIHYYEELGILAKKLNLERVDELGVFFLRLKYLKSTESEFEKRKSKVSEASYFLKYADKLFEDLGNNTAKVHSLTIKEAKKLYRTGYVNQFKNHDLNLQASIGMREVLSKTIEGIIIGLFQPEFLNLGKRGKANTLGRYQLFYQIFHQFLLDNKLEGSFLPAATKLAELAGVINQKKYAEKKAESGFQMSIEQYFLQKLKMKVADFQVTPISNI